MPIKSLSWTANKKIPCGANTPSAIVIYVDSDLLAQRPCPFDPTVPPQTTDDTSYAWHTIQATLTSEIHGIDGCKRDQWTYIAEYDDSQIINGGTLLATDIKGVVCKGAVTSYIEDMAGQGVKIQLVPGSPPQIQLVNQHGCIFTLDSLDSNGMSSGSWGTPPLDLPDCDIDSGQVIYVDSAGRLRAEPNYPYFHPVRVDGGVYDPGAGVIPADLFEGGAVDLSFTNDSCRDVSFTPLIELPSVSMNAIAGNDWNIVTNIAPSYAASVDAGTSRIYTVGGSSNALITPSAFTSYPGPVIVQPATTIVIHLKWIFNRTLYAADPFNRLRVFGPRATYIAHAI